MSPADLTQPGPQHRLHVAGLSRARRWAERCWPTTAHARRWDAPETLLQHHHSAAPAARTHKFPRFNNLSMSMSNACSPTIFFSRASPAAAWRPRLSSRRTGYAIDTQVASVISRCLHNSSPWPNCFSTLPPLADDLLQRMPPTSRSHRPESSYTHHQAWVLTTDRPLSGNPVTPIQRVAAAKGRLVNREGQLPGRGSGS